jgi:hypothetical protein
MQARLKDLLFASNCPEIPPGVELGVEEGVVFLGKLVVAMTNFSCLLRLQFPADSIIRFCVSHLESWTSNHGAIQGESVLSTSDSLVLKALTHPFLLF